MTEFCEVCGLSRDEHPTPPPGPPTPPPMRHEGVWRPPHEFRASKHTLSELLDERDAQIDLWRRRFYASERQLERVRQAFFNATLAEPEEGE